MTSNDNTEVSPVTITFTNDLKDTDASPEMVRQGQQAIVLAGCQQAIFCQVSGKLLDKRQTVVVMPRGERMMVVHCSVWDERKALVADKMAETGTEVEVYDGRELW
jgi:hypothetical protein